MKPEAKHQKAKQGLQKVLLMLLDAVLGGITFIILLAVSLLSLHRLGFSPFLISPI